MGAGAWVVDGGRTAGRGWWGVGRLLRGGLLVLALLLGLSPVRAQAPELLSFELRRDDGGLSLSHALRFELPPMVEDALARGVPIYFVTEVDVYRARWYWRDRRVARAERTWRLAFQPLTRRYRLSLGSLSQTHERLEDALAVIKRGTGWQIAEPGTIEDGARHYVEFGFRLDTTQLPRPLQIGFGNQADWSLQLEHRALVPEPPRQP